LRSTAQTAHTVRSRMIDKAIDNIAGLAGAREHLENATDPTPLCIIGESTHNTPRGRSYRGKDKVAKVRFLSCVGENPVKGTRFPVRPEGELVGQRVEKPDKFRTFDLRGPKWCRAQLAGSDP
jgi:hypothetical protein